MKPPVFLTSTFVFNSAEHGKEFFDYVAGRREPPQGRGRRPRLFALQPPECRDRRGSPRDLRGGGSGPPVLVRHVGHRHDDPGLRPAGRRDPALAAALWRHRDPDRQDARQHGHRSPSASATASTRRASGQPRRRRMGKGRVSVIMIEIALQSRSTPSWTSRSSRRIADEIGAAAGPPPGHRLRQHSARAASIRSRSSTAPTSRSIR